MRRAALVVTHCGHGTTIKALAAGAPLLCIPMGRDQNDTAARVVHRGAGIRLSPDSSAKRIGEAVDRLLADPAFAHAAAFMSTVIERELSGVDIATHFEDVAAGSAALRS